MSNGNGIYTTINPLHFFPHYSELLPILNGILTVKFLDSRDVENDIQTPLPIYIYLYLQLLYPVIN